MNDEPECVRVQKLLADMGLASRRKVEDKIRAGVVLINGQVAQLGDRVKEEDLIEVDGVEIVVKEKSNRPVRMLMYHKPEGEVCTRTDPQGRPTVFDDLPFLDEQRWVVVGRLDINTTGLILFTTDGNLANRLMHPSSQVEREYQVRVYGSVSEAQLNELRRGVELEDGIARFSQLSEGRGDGKNKWYTVVLNEGKNREVRRLWEKVGAQVNRLIRVRFGHLTLPEDLDVGEWVELDSEISKKLGDQVGVKLKRRSGLYGRAKVRADDRPEKTKAPADDDANNRKGGYLRRRRP